MADPIDPFSIVHQRLWTILTEFPDWLALVTTNIVRFDAGQPHPPRLDLMLDDTNVPEMALVQGRFWWEPHQLNSKAAGITQDYVLLTTARDHQVIPHNLLKWHTLRAWTLAGGQIGLPSLIRTVACVDGLDDAYGEGWGKGGSQRWTAHVTARVEMFVKLDAVKSGVIPQT